MDYDASFAERQARLIGDGLRDLRDRVRENIVAGAGFPVDPRTIRVRRREIRNEAYDVALAAVPTSDPDLRRILPNYPTSSATGPGAPLSDDYRSEARGRIADGIVEAVSSRIPAVVWEQFDCATPSDFLEQLQPAVDKLAEVDAELADDFRSACSAMLAEDETRMQDLAAPLEEMRKVLVHEGKMGNRDMLVAGRLVMEMADFLDGRHGLLDRAHVPATAPRL